LSFFYSHRLPIAEASLAKGFDVVIGYGDLGGIDPILFKHKGFKTFLIPMQRGGLNIFKDLKTFFYIWKFFKKERPDIVHLVTIKPYLYGGIISRLTKVPCLVSAVSGLGTLFVCNDFKSKLLLLLLYPFYRLAFNHVNQKVIVQNEQDAEILVKWGVLNSLKVKLIKGSGVNLKKFKNFDEPNGTLVVTFAARLLRDKGVYEFAEAARLLRQKGVQARFCVAGDLDAKNPTGLNLDDLNKLKTKGHVEILGHQKDIPALYARSHIICLPSYYREGLPKTLIEAAAAGRAVITTDVAGCRDAVIPNKTGLLVPAKDSQKLANALQWLLEHPQERIAMGKAGRKLAEKEFKIEKIVKEHLEIYQELCKKII
jgi:glycosyltransferase involved in cell wall biosynthesis